MVIRRLKVSLIHLNLGYLFHSKIYAFDHIWILICRNVSVLDLPQHRKDLLAWSLIDVFFYRRELLLVELAEVFEGQLIHVLRDFVYEDNLELLVVHIQCLQDLLAISSCNSPEVWVTSKDCFFLKDLHP